MEADIDKKIAIITSYLPNPFSAGGALTVYSILLAFINKGYKVSIISWLLPRFLDEDKEKEVIYNLKSIGVDFSLLKTNSESKGFIKYLHKKIKPDIGDIFPWFYAKEEIKNLLNKIKPNALLIYHWEGLAATYGIKSFPKLGIVVDPFHLPYLYRREFKKEFDEKPVPFEKFRDIFTRRTIEYQKIFMKRLLEDCNSCGEFAFHHAEMFRSWGISHCRYFRTPLLDPFTNGKKTRNLPDKPKMLLLGHLKGIATLNGINLFVKEILPYLERELGRDRFEIHIIGGFFDSLPKRLKKDLTHSCIRIRGHITSIENEFLTSHLLLVPTPIELGMRVRIATAFSFGTPVIAHTANKKGIPELEHNKNILLSDTGKGLAKETVRLIKDRSLQATLSENGRQTYEKYFSLDTAGKEIVEAVEGLV